VFLLPWERLLPPWLLGPLLVLVGVGALLFDKHLAWWEWLLLPLTALFGAWGTWVWFATGENVFCSSGQRPGR